MTFKRGIAAVLLAAAVVVGLLLANISGASTSQPTVKKRTIGYVDIVAAGAMQRRWYNFFKAATNKLGWKVLLQDAKGNPSVGLNAAQSLVNQGVDALVVSCIDTASMRPALDAAKAKGIPTIQVGCPVPPPYGVWDGIYAEDEAALSRTLAKYVIQDLGPSGGEVGSLYDNTILPGRIRNAVFKATLRGSKVKVVAEQAIDLTNIAEGSRQATATFLTAHPNLKAIIAIYDFFAPPAVSAIQTAGKADQVKVYAWYADQVNLPLMLAPGSPVSALVDGPVEQVSLVAIDQLLRHFETGAKIDLNASKKLKIKYVIFTKKNHPKYFKSYITPWNVNTYLAPYLKKWSKEYGIRFS